MGNRPDYASRPPKVRTGKSVAVVGSGPSGLAAADAAEHAAAILLRYLNADDRVGGLLRYGIPNMKLDKSVIDRRCGSDGRRRASSL